MKQYLLPLILLITAFSDPFSAKAENVVDKVAARLSSSPSVKAEYTVTSVTEGTVSGTLTLAGDKFLMTSPGMTSWYDGTTQWTYIKSEQEVNVINPTIDELALINPLIIINNFRKNYNHKSDAAKGNTTTLHFTSKDKKATITSASVIVDNTSYLPQNIDITLSDRRHITILLSNIEIGKKLPASYFRFDKKSYPNAEIIDLR